MKNENFSLESLKKSKRDFAFDRQYTTDVIFDRVVNLVEEFCKKNNLKKKDLAHLLDRDQAIVSRWLNSPQNWQISTFANLLTAIDMRLIDLLIEEASDEQRQTNHLHDFEVELGQASTPKISKSFGMTFDHVDSKDRLKSQPKEFAVGD